MTEQEAEQYKALLIWAKALDAAAEAAQARVNSNLASNRDVAEGMRCALDSRRAEAMEDLLRPAVVPTELAPSSSETKTRYMIAPARAVIRLTPQSVKSADYCLRSARGLGADPLPVA